MTGPAAVVDLDGTLVDSSYHHVLAWARAFRFCGVRVALRTLHEHMGMGGDRLVAAVAGEDVEVERGDAIRQRWSSSYDALLQEVAPIPGATELLSALAGRGWEVVIATSGKPSHTRRTLGLLGLTIDDYATTTSEDVDVTKPAADLVQVALGKVGADQGFALGDTIWDVKAARAAGIPAVAVESGGIGAHTLRDAKASAVYRSAQEVLDNLDEVLDLVQVARP